jgi:hypothetical protein
MKEEPDRAMEQLRNIARGFALSKGRNYITKEDLSLDTETKKTIHSLLLRTTNKFEGDPSIYSEMEVFLSKNIVGVEQQ